MDTLTTVLDSSCSYPTEPKQILPWAICLAVGVAIRWIEKTLLKKKHKKELEAAKEGK